MSDTIHDNIPPQACEQEKAVLGGIMIDPDAFEKIEGRLLPDMMYRPAHQQILNAIYTLKEAGKPTDLLMVSEQLKTMELLDHIGGSYYLTELCEYIPSAANIVFHADIIVEKYKRRKAISMAQILLENLYGTIDLESSLDTAGKISLLGSVGVMDNQTTFHDSLLEALDTADNLKGRELTGISTTIENLDKMTKGLQNQELIVIAGATSHGKTSFALQIAYEAAKLNTVLFFSLEMPHNQLSLRIAAQQAKVNFFKLRHGALSDEDWQKLSIRTAEISRMPIIIDDKPSADHHYISSVTRQVHRTSPLSAVFIDYLGLMTHHGSSSDNLAKKIGYTVKHLRALGKELKIPIVLLHQVNRDWSKEKRRPQLQDLRDSGEIEQDADVVLFVYRPSKDPNQFHKSCIIVAKQRNGPLGSINTHFKGEYTMFFDTTQTWEGDGW